MIIYKPYTINALAGLVHYNNATSGDLHNIIILYCLALNHIFTQLNLQ